MSTSRLPSTYLERAAFLLAGTNANGVATGWSGTDVIFKLDILKMEALRKGKRATPNLDRAANLLAAPENDGVWKAVTSATEARKQMIAEAKAEGGDAPQAPGGEQEEENVAEASTSKTAATKKPAAKKATKASKSKDDEPVAGNWEDVVIEGADEDGDVPIYDDCNDIRRKVRAHLGEGNKITHFLKEIGGINSNSYRRFMQLSGPTKGCENGFYQAAYIYFEKNRILKKGKKVRQTYRQREGVSRWKTNVRRLSRCLGYGE